MAGKRLAKKSSRLGQSPGGSATQLGPTPKRVGGLLRYIASHTFTPFAWYRIAFGVVVLVTAQMGWVTWAD